MNDLSLKYCLWEASEPVYGRSPQEADEDTILWVVMGIPKHYTKTREAVLNALLADDRKGAVEILNQKINDFVGTDQSILSSLKRVRDEIIRLKHGDFKTVVSQQGFADEWEREIKGR